MVAVWAWEDEAAGRLRARVFPNGIGIAEDEATGAAALQLGALLGRDLVIRQGEGSELHVRPGRDGTVAVGGRVELVSERSYEAGPSASPAESPAGSRPRSSCAAVAARGCRSMRRRSQAARRGRRAADRLARRLDPRRPGRRARAAADGLPGRAGRGVRRGGANGPAACASSASTRPRHPDRRAIVPRGRLTSQAAGDRDRARERGEIKKADHCGDAIVLVLDRRQTSPPNSHRPEESATACRHSNLLKAWRHTDIVTCRVGRAAHAACILAK